MLKRVATMAAAAALLVAPVAAAETVPATSIRALSVSDSMRSGNELSGGLSFGWIAGAVFVVAVVGLLVLGGDDETDMPVSP